MIFDLLAESHSSIENIEMKERWEVKVLQLLIVEKQTEKGLALKFRPPEQ